MIFSTSPRRPASAPRRKPTAAANSGRISRASAASDRFTAAEAAFIAERDSFYMATVSESGWPYVQHRGGPPGFIRVLDEKTLAIPDFRGNRQYISAGNLSRQRPRRADPDGLSQPAPPQDLCACRGEGSCGRSGTGGQASPCQATGPRSSARLIIHLVAFDWNCPQHITQRFSEAELAPALAPLRERLEALEAENEALRAQLLAKGD